MPVALIASTMAIVGAMVGLALPTHYPTRSATILAIVVIMLSAKIGTASCGTGGPSLHRTKNHGNLS